MTRRRLPVLVAVAIVAFTVISSAGAGGAPSIAFRPSSNVYGPIGSGTTASKTFTLTNSGGVATGALKVSLTGASAFSKTADTCTAASLGPKKTCSVTVQYAPTTDGASDSGTLTATSKKPAATASASLTGSSTAASADISLGYNPVGDFPANVFIASAGPAAATVSVFVSGVTSIGAAASVFQVTGDAATGFTVTTVDPIAAGEAEGFYITGTVKAGAYAEVSASSAPDPDSTPNNQVPLEDDYVVVPGSATQSQFDCASYSGTFATGTGLTLWTCNGWLSTSLSDFNSKATTLGLTDCIGLDGGTAADGAQTPPDAAGAADTTCAA
jgi:hypothetical protein